MAHIIIRAGSATTNELPMQVIVDGVDLTEHTFRDGFAVDFNFGEFPDEQQVAVHLPLAADALEIDLPDAVLTATVAQVTA